jgi:hypothetical protein
MNGRTQVYYDQLKAEAKAADQGFVDEIAQIKRQINELEHRLVAKEYEREDMAQSWSLRIGRIAEFEEPQLKNQVEIVYVDDYYYVRSQNLWYHISFLVEWAINQEQGRGCFNCSDCSAFAKLNGVVIGYCTDCAWNGYKNKRGCGFGPGGHSQYKDLNPHLNCVDLSTIRAPKL